MSEYSVKCIGCSDNFELICNNCNHRQFKDTSKDPSKKNIQCNKCGKKVNAVKHECFAWFSNPKPKTTYCKNNPERFTNLSQKAAKHSEELFRRKAEYESERAERENEAYRAKLKNINEKKKAEEKRIAEELELSNPIIVLNRQIEEIKKSQEKILNDLESEGCLLYLLSNRELRDYAKNTGIEINNDQGHFEVMHQIALSEGNIDTSQPNWNFNSLDTVIVKRFRKIYKNKVKYVKSANDQLIHLKSQMDKALKDKQKQEEMDLQEAIDKYRIELEIKEKRIAEKKKAEEKRIAENLRNEEINKTKENLKKRFF
jgi:phosphoenolpyruvate carboxylase